MAAKGEMEEMIDTQKEADERSEAIKELEELISRMRDEASKTGDHFVCFIGGKDHEIDERSG